MRNEKDKDKEGIVIRTNKLAKKFGYRIEVDNVSLASRQVEKPPFTPQLDASSGLLSGAHFSEISDHFIVILIYALALFLLPILSFKWRMKNI